MYLVANALLLFWGSRLHAEETPQNIIDELLAQEICECFEVVELLVEGGTRKTILLFRKIGQDKQEVRLQVVSRGADEGYAYYSRIDAATKDHLRDIMWVYRPQDKVRRYNSILHAFLDTGIPPYFVDRAGWWGFYTWALMGPRQLVGTPFADYSFLPEVVITWDKTGESRFVSSINLVAQGEVFLTATFSDPRRINGKVRPAQVVIGPPNGPFTTIILRMVRFEEPDKEWLAQIFHRDRLPERRTPSDLRTRQHEVLARIDF
jgi:hypothetical protein